MNEITYERMPTENANSVYSVGTAVAINSFEQLYSEYKYNVIAINVGTLLRNHATKDTSLQDVINMFNTEITVMLNEVTSIMNSNGASPNSYVLLYGINYNRCLQEILVRPETPSRKLVNDATNYIIDRSRELFGPKGEGTFNGIKVRFESMQTGEPSIYKRLYNLMSKQGMLLKVIMISHYPIDYHVARYVDKFVLLETHTGKWKLIDELSVKIFGEKFKELPFLPSTHLCFGDKPLISMNISTKQKDDLLQTSRKQGWRLKSANYIKSEIKRKYNFPSTLFRQLGD